jgi:hypothetical protein
MLKAGTWSGSVLPSRDNAAIWAALVMEEFAVGCVLFEERWSSFREQFKAHFETVDEAVDAKERLYVLWQDTSTVPEYAVLFKESMARTGYSQSDLRDRFYEHLSPQIKDELIHTARPIGTLNELITAASQIDIRFCQRCAERDRERKSSGVITGITTAQTPSMTPFVPPVADPAPMEVDATRTREEWLSQMHGRCFSCGSTTHAKRDGNHDRDLCTGHREVVCLNKFVGKAKSQKAAAVVLPSETDSGVNTPEEAFVNFNDTETVASTSMTLTGLLDQQKSLAEQITVWRDSDF